MYFVLYEFGNILLHRCDYYILFVSKIYGYNMFTYGSAMLYHLLGNV